MKRYKMFMICSNNSLPFQVRAVIGTRESQEVADRSVNGCFQFTGGILLGAGQF